MPMPVVQVWPVGVCMHERPVTMRVTVGFAWLIIGVMFMLVVFVMHVSVRMVHFVVIVIMGMAFSHMQPRAKGHEEARKHKHAR